MKPWLDSGKRDMGLASPLPGSRDTLVFTDSFHLLVWVQVYYVYGFMLLVFVILMIVTVCVTIVGTYFLLNAENYHWQWTSFCAAASTALCATFPFPLLPMLSPTASTACMVMPLHHALAFLRKC